MFYRAPHCKTCHVKTGLGNCARCVSLRESLVSLEQSVLARFGQMQAQKAEVEVIDENDRDAWKPSRRCPDCHDDATAFNVSACPTCMGEGYIDGE